MLFIEPYFAEYGYIGLFVLSFLAATVLPFSSEVVFFGMLLGGYDAWTCTLVATAGNWLGGLTCYYIGYLGKIEWIEKYLKIDKEKLDKWLYKTQKYGGWLAFFSFVPFAGDAIVVATGFLRCRFLIVAFALLAGKFLRYALIMYANNLLF